MSAISVRRQFEAAYTPTRDDQFVITVGDQEPLVLSEADAKKLRDALCVMVGTPKVKKK
jgi:hypothetical protein